MKAWCEECGWSIDTEQDSSLGDVTEEALTYHYETHHLPIKTNRTLGSETDERHTELSLRSGSQLNIPSHAQ